MLITVARGQVLARIELSGQSASLTLAYRNTGGQPLEGLSATASSTTQGLFVQAMPLAQGALAPGQTATQQVRAVCMEPFVAPASVLVEFTTAEAPGLAARHSYPLPLPLSVLHFLAPVEMNRAGFLAQWEAIKVPEVMDAFAAPRALNPDAVVALVSGSFRTALVRELCMRNEQLSVLAMACSIETGTIADNGRQVRIGALLRLEMSHKANAYRLTVRAQHPLGAQAIFRAVKQQLLAL
jgi:hypothetical protein